MLKGDFEAAWKFSDQVLESRKDVPCWHLPRHQQYIWNGSSLAGKRVLIRCYHGLGDTIQFIRYAPLIKSIAKQVIVWAQEPLIPLLKTVEGIDLILPLHDGAPDVQYDVDVEVMELPFIFRTSLDTVPNDVPYIHVQPKNVLTKSQKPIVGLVWKVGNWGESRSIHFKHLLPLFDCTSCELVILQSDPKNAGWSEGYGYYPGAFSLYDFACVIRSLDLLVCVDSMPVHVAGAQNVPVWVMLERYADWRWMEDRDDSPWYPSARLFRQPQEGDWDAIVQNVMVELNSFVAQQTD